MMVAVFRHGGIVTCDSDGHPDQYSPSRISTGTKYFTKYSIQASSFSDVHSHCLKWCSWRTRKQWLVSGLCPSKQEKKLFNSSANVVSEGVVTGVEPL